MSSSSSSINEDERKRIQLFPIPSHVENHPNGISYKFQQFLSKCKEIDDSEAMRLAIMKLNQKFESAGDAYKESEHFRNLIDSKHLEVVQMRLPFQNLKDILGELKLNQKPKQSEEAGGINAKKIRVLERLLERLSLKIKELEEKEIDFNDENDDTYVLESRYKDRFNQVYKKLCELKQEPSHAGRITGMKIKFMESAYPAVNKAIENYHSKYREFPDFQDVYDLIVAVNEKEKLGLSKAQTNAVATTTFRSFGSRLKKFRIMDDKDILDSYLNEDQQDPADNDPELAEKLKNNFIVYEEKRNKIIDEYALKQEEMKEKGLDADSEADSKNDEEEADSKDDEEEADSKDDEEEADSKDDEEEADSTDDELEIVSSDEGSISTGSNDFDLADLEAIDYTFDPESFDRATNGFKILKDLKVSITDISRSDFYAKYFEEQKPENLLIEGAGIAENNEETIESSKGIMDLDVTIRNDTAEAKTVDLSSSENKTDIVIVNEVSQHFQEVNGDTKPDVIICAESISTPNREIIAADLNENEIVILDEVVHSSCARNETERGPNILKEYNEVGDSQNKVDRISRKRRNCKVFDNKKSKLSAGEECNTADKEKSPDVILIGEVRTARNPTIVRRETATSQNYEDTSDDDITIVGEVQRNENWSYSRSTPSGCVSSQSIGVATSPRIFPPHLHSRHPGNARYRSADPQQNMNSTNRRRMRREGNHFQAFVQGQYQGNMAKVTASEQLDVVFCRDGDGNVNQVTRRIVKTTIEEQISVQPNAATFPRSRLRVPDNDDVITLD